MSILEFKRQSGSGLRQKRIHFILLSAILDGIPLIVLQNAVICKLQAAMGLMQMMWRDYEKHCSTLPVVFTGQSRGGALSSIAAVITNKFPAKLVKGFGMYATIQRKPRLLC
jgi:hypothetical protein